MSDNWVDAELKNWSRWCNLGGTILPWGVSAIVLFDENVAPTPIHEENAKRVQKVFEVAPLIERKVLQAEYLSPSRYSRYPGSIPAAVDRIKKLEPDLTINLTVAVYERALANVKRRVERVFQ
ncbi:hypothetical protein [Paraburkholderia tropica]|uniref:hypothetical protein n=1 Tax=Paraburkholderia tropica TaxID=92647 RepID=UPI003D294859